MKYLLVLIVVVVGAWMLLSRTRRRVDPPRPTPKAEGHSQPAEGRGRPDTMVACAHCGVHLPQPDAVADGAGRPYCSDAHRLSGPR